METKSHFWFSGMYMAVYTSLRKAVFISEGSREGQVDICHLNKSYQISLGA